MRQSTRGVVCSQSPNLFFSSQETIFFRLFMIPFSRLKFRYILHRMCHFVYSAILEWLPLVLVNYFNKILPHINLVESAWFSPSPWQLRESGNPNILHPEISGTCASSYAQVKTERMQWCHLLWLYWWLFCDSCIQLMTMHTHSHRCFCLHGNRSYILSLVITV